jgi:hypothetical protein
MPLHVTKWERRDGVDRDAFANGALAICRNARATDGVRNSRFYWATIDQIAVLVDADAGAWGPGSGTGPTPEGTKVFFGMSDVAHMRSQETWGDAGPGEEAYRMSK